MKNLPFLVALHNVDGLGSARIKLLLDYFEDPQVIWHSSIKEIRSLGVPEAVCRNLAETRKFFQVEEYFAKIQSAQIKILTFFDSDYPEQLKQIHNPPLVLYYQGIIPSISQAVAVVGSRRMSSYGRTITTHLTKDLIDAGCVIVSGLARGVDTIAHQTAVESGGQTIAVLGGGLLKLFPQENTRLAQAIVESRGLILSEYPPDSPSLPVNFPARNRIISGLSQAVVVTEATEDSGSLITAKLALEQGKEVCAVPGPVTSPMSTGPLKLIQQGAKLIINSQDILECLGLTSGRPVIKLDFSQLDQTELGIVTLLQQESLHIDEIIRRSGLNSSAVSGLLIKMEIAGFVTNIGDGTYAIMNT